MLLEVLRHTPIWVFIVFFLLLYLGYKQSMDREVSLKKLFILPVAMTAFALFGLVSSFGFSGIALTVWLLAMATFIYLHIKLTPPRKAVFSKEKDKLFISGSWVPLILMMCLFFTKYLVGFSLANHFGFTKSTIFLVVVSLAYGAFSGTFSGRTLVRLRSVKPSLAQQ